MDSTSKYDQLPHNPTGDLLSSQRTSIACRSVRKAGCWLFGSDECIVASVLRSSSLVDCRPGVEAAVMCALQW
jgi:hypothetical protein